MRVYSKVFGETDQFRDCARHLEEKDEKLLIEIFSGQVEAAIRTSLLVVWPTRNRVTTICMLEKKIVSYESVI